MARHTQQQVRLSLRCTRWRCFRLTRLICWKTWIKVRACHLMKRLSCAAPRIWLYVPLSRPPLLWAGLCGGHGGNGETSVGNLADIGKKEKGFLLDAPVSPSELFGTSVETVVEKFREAKARSAASNPSFLEVQVWARTTQWVLTHLRLRIRDGHRGLVSRPVPLPACG